MIGIDCMILRKYYTSSGKCKCYCQCISKKLKITKVRYKDKKEKIGYGVEWDTTS